MRFFLSVVLGLLFASCGAAQAACAEYRTNSFNYELTNWYPSKQEACTASAEAYQNKINETYPAVVDYVGTFSTNDGVCHRDGWVKYSNGQVGRIASQDVGWFNERACQYKPEETSCSVGNPTLPGLGTKTHHEPIYAGSFTAPLTFELNYRSVYSGRSMVPSGAWLHSFSKRLQIDPLVGDAHAVASDGSVVRFAKGATANVWTSTESGDVLKQIPASDPAAVLWELQRHKEHAREIYDHTGRLLKTTALNEWVTSLAYSAAGQLQSVSNAFGRQLNFTWDAQGLLASLTAPGGDITRFSHDIQGNLVSIAWPDGNVKRFHYEDARFPRALTGVTDETSQRIGSYTYDAQGRISTTERANGVDRLQFGYGTDAAGMPQTQITDFTSGAPTTRTHRFTTQGRVLRPAGVSAPCPLCGGTAQAITYDEAGRKLRERLHDGSVVFYQYGERGLEIERATFPPVFTLATVRPDLANATSVVSTQWQGGLNLPRRIVEPGRFTEYAYSFRGLAWVTTQSTTDPTGAASFYAVKTGPIYKTDYTYNEQSLNTRIIERIDRVATQQWDLGYNGLGELIRIVDVTGKTFTRVTNDSQGRVSRLVAINGAMATFSANSRGQMTAAYTPGGNVVYNYDARNLINEIRFSDGRWVRYTYNAAQKLIEIRDSSGLAEQIAASDEEGFDAGRLARRVAQWLDGRGDRITRMLISDANANPVVALIPAGLVLGIMTIAEANRVNAVSSQGVSAITCGAACQGSAVGSAGPSSAVPSVAAIGWLTQVGVLLSGQAQTSSTATAPAYDKAGLLVSPKACAPPPGNCDPEKWRQLQDDVNEKCKSTPSRCKGGMSRAELLANLETNRSCARARDTINKKCFAGGDLVHRDSAIDAWGSVARCESILGLTP